jgi:hypothetical protein
VAGHEKRGESTGEIIYFIYVIIKMFCLRHGLTYYSAGPRQTLPPKVET